MSNSNYFVKTLYNLSLDSLCDNLNEEALQHVLKFLPPSIVLEVVWKILRVDDEIKDLVGGYSVPGIEMPSVQRGSKLLEMYLHQTGHETDVSYRNMDLEAHGLFASFQQVALDSRHNLFGYFNLNTAIAFVDYAYARYVGDYSIIDYDEAMRSLLQGIFIMKRIGIPDNNMILLNAECIIALIIEEKVLDIVERGMEYCLADIHASALLQMLKTMKNKMLSDAEAIHLKALEVSFKAVGENTLLAANSYCNLGRLYESQKKYSESEKMHLKAIVIKESILGKDNPEVALSLGHLARFYTYQFKKIKEAEVLYLRSKTIYETTYGHQYTGLLYGYVGLREVYKQLKEIDKYTEYTNHILGFQNTCQDWLHRMHTTFSLNCTKDDSSLEKFKCILNECICEKYSI